MRRKIPYAAALCLLCLGLPGCEAPKAVNLPRAAGSTILNKKEAKYAVTQCSRDRPRNIVGFWVPTKSDIQELERHTDRLMALESDRCCGEGGKIPRPLGKYYVQYAGIVIAGRRMIYLNAMPAGVSDAESGHSGNARRDEVMMTCDGGDSFWGAVYDPQTRTFRELAFNGIG